MSKVVLSNGYEFSLVANGTNVGNNNVSITFIPGDYTLEQLETMWTGNANIKVVLDEGSQAGETIANYANYVNVSSISKNNQYPKETTTTTTDSTTTDSTTTTEEEYQTVVTVVCAKGDLTSRVSNLESSVDDLVNAIIG